MVYIEREYHMREILFKAKSAFNNNWYEGYAIRYGKNDWYILECNDEEVIWRKCIPETFCQYTEYKDEEGNKIFENDFVGYFSDKDTKNFIEFRIGYRGIYPILIGVNGYIDYLSLLAENNILNGFKITGNYFNS